MVLVGLLRLQGRQGDAAAGDQGAACGVEDVPAEGTDIKLGPQEVGGAVGVDHLLTGEELRQRDPQGGGQGLQKGHIRQSPAGLPLGDGLAADGEPLRQLLLGQAPALPQGFDCGAGDIGVHRGHLLSEESIADPRQTGNLRSVEP